MNYEEMSDFEINKRVAKAQHFLTHWSTSKHVKVSMQSCEEPCGSRIYDPCNNPADAWPIITEMMNDSHIFTISDVAILWHGESDSDDVIIECEYPLRAFMICYLMMQEAK